MNLESCYCELWALRSVQVFGWKCLNAMQVILIQSHCSILSLSPSFNRIDVLKPCPEMSANVTFYLLWIASADVVALLLMASLTPRALITVQESLAMIPNVEGFTNPLALLLTGLSTTLLHPAQISFPFIWTNKILWAIFSVHCIWAL